MKETWATEQTLNRNANILLIITSMILLCFCILFLWIPTTKKKMIYGIVSQKNHIQTYLSKTDLDTIQTWNCGNSFCEVVSIKEEVLQKEDGQNYYFVTLKVTLPNEKNKKGNYVLYEITKKQSKYHQWQEWIRSVMM